MIEEKIRSILRNNFELRVPVHQITGKDCLKDIGINSLDYVKLIVIIERELNIVFDDSELDINSVKNIDNFIAFIENKIKK